MQKSSIQSVTYHNCSSYNCVSDTFHSNKNAAKVTVGYGFLKLQWKSDEKNHSTEISSSTTHR